MILQEWFDQLAPRERLMVLACGVLIVIALIWALAIQPVLQGRANLAVQVAEKEAQLANLQELASQVQPGTTAAQSVSQGRNESIVIIVDRTTRNRQLATYLKRNQPEGDTGVRLRFEGAPFDQLIEWLGEIQGYGMTTSTANFDVAGTGRVNCSLLLNRGGT